MSNKILGDDFGLVLELGVNIGILAGIKQLTNKNKMLSQVHPLYNDELKNMKLSKIVSGLKNKALRNGVSDPTLLKKSATFIEYLIFLGVHKGLNFIVEYCQSMQDAIKTFRNEPLSTQSQKCDTPTLLYYQCDLQQLFNTDDFARYDLLIPKLDKMFKLLGSQFKPDYQRYQHRGQFLNADIIMLFHLHDRYRVVVIDVGLFSVADIANVPDLHDVLTIKQRLKTSFYYMRGKTAFEHLNIDSEKADIQYSPDLADYFEAFARDDKDSYKMIQAGGYAHSFVQCLKTLQPERFNDNTLEINSIGLTDRAYNAIFIADKADMPILQIFQIIYQRSKAQTRGMAYSKKRAISIQSIFNIIYRNFKRTLKRNKYHNRQNIDTFVEQLQTLPAPESSINQVTYTETLKDFYSSADKVPTEILAELKLANDLNFRDAHAKLITKAMYNDNLLLFLTGNPGIGKTTAIVNYIRQPNILSEGVLFFYFSPRTQVNRDIIEKFSQINNGKRIVKDDSLIVIYSNSLLISNYDKLPVIQYVSNMPLPSTLKMPSSLGGKKSILKLVADDEQVVSHNSGNTRTQSRSDNQINYNRHIPQGVLNTVCSAICTLRQADNIFPKNIIATATVQSLKKTGKNTTAEHLRKIFADAAQDKQLKNFDEVKLAQIARTTRHIIFMVDEVIGDSSGAELLYELVKMVKKLKLEPHFKIKIIASDASIAGNDVIKQYLSKREPSPAKILYRQIDKNIDAKPLSIQQDKVKIGLYKRDATIINANTFPASELVLDYKISIEMQPIDLKKKDCKIQQNWIEQDIFKLLCNPSIDGQIIVYIQDINRLNQLIIAISNKKSELPTATFEEFQDYLQIHSSLSDKDRKKIHQYKNTVKIIFMTSSASRGITFARVRRIFIEVPKFKIENNLMEIIQTIYRGRGGETKQERALEKERRWLTFYLHDIVHYPAWEQQAYLRGITGLMNMILLLRAALKTRFAGYGDIGRKRELRIIPVGGKHVNSVGDSLLTAVARLLTELRREIRRRFDEPEVSSYSLLKLREDIRNIFKRTQTRVVNETLKKVETYYEDFAQCAQKSFYHLLTHDFEQDYYIDGDIFTVPITNSEERINIPKDMLNAAKTEKLVERMQKCITDPKYTNNLKVALTKLAKEIHKIQQTAVETSYSQDIYSKNSSGGQYLSIPLSVFFKPKIFQKYFRPGSETMNYEAETTDRDSFRDVIGNYLYLLYQIDDKLPLDGGYDNFPFLLFRCDNLTIIRQQRFDRRYMFSSTAFNLINLVLSEADDG